MNRFNPTPVVPSKAVYKYAYCPNEGCHEEVYPDDKFCRKCGQALLSPTASAPAPAPMVYFKGIIWGTKDKWVAGAHYFDGKRSYIITDIPNTDLVLYGHRSDNVEMYAVNPGTVEMITEELCPICGKPILKAQWFDIAKQDGKNIPVRTVVDWHPTSSTYDLSGIAGIFEVLYSFDPEKFTRQDMEEVEIFEDDMGAHCLRCGATL